MTSKITQLHGLDPQELINALKIALKEELMAFKSESLAARHGEPPQYLTRTEAAELLKVSTVTLNDWAKKGIVKRKHIGNMVRYELSDLKNAVQ